MTRDEPLAALEGHAGFERRHIGSDATEQAQMLREVGYASLSALADAAVPDGIRLTGAMPLAAPLSEAEALARLAAIASKNRVLKSMIGQGYYGTYTPGVIQRNVLENPAWYTAYTPYQPEISQGRLEALLTFQSMVCDLTGMEIANASMLDEATAAAEAMTLLRRVSSAPGTRFFVADDVFAQTLAVVRTRAAPLGIEVVTGPASAAADAGSFGILLQYPGADGEIADYRALVDAAHAKGALVAVATDLLALALLTPPGEWGTDVTVGSSQRFGVPMGYGGPHAGFIATRDMYKRSLPGRLVGVSIDAAGKPAYRLALQTREQHIRREKATSNICTAQVLLAVMAAMYAVYHGAEGLTRIARRVERLTAILRTGLERRGFRARNAHAFDTLTLETGTATDAIHARAEAAGYNLRRAGPDKIGISLDETTTRDDVVALWHAFDGTAAGKTASSLDAGVTPLDAGITPLGAGATPPGAEIDTLDATVASGLPAPLVRSSALLTHPVFASHRSETEMLRYLRGLADKDLALDRTMIPLGSCTMKLNATSEMLPVSWAHFAAMHPFVPADQARGYAEVAADLERMLCAVTGYDAVSLQPNAGSQGEYAGLLMIRAFHASRGDAHRDVCLIPASAHGTNPASAHLAGMRVLVVECDREGNVDIDDLEAKASTHRSDLAAIMVTYPSTHGVFEPGIVRVCEIVHAHGGQVYVDGANLNALVGLAAPGTFGADVSHLNLHKTFCIPHGGGGPGVGPVACRAHLAPFLPGKPGGPQVSAAPLGSASILPISWMYIAMMGADGLTAATGSAILAANYVAKRLAPHYPVLYSGRAALVAHECILDLRPLKASTGIEVEDVAKRLIDYGFHAPTMSFPVPGTLMVEPTESESKDELDRFVDAMIAIRGEIRAIEEGRANRDDNPLKHAPHTAAAIAAADWPHPYTREEAAFPLAGIAARKYWCPVARVDNVYGDRNLVARIDIIAH
ncbi:MAG TPA: glycine dehydrogenase (aminomethyl-transferring) [Casimicrobiaceae bacterium]